MELFKEVVYDKTGASMDCYLYGQYNEMPLSEKRPAILICPGGGYGIVSPREAEPVAHAFMAKGYHVFVLKYSVQGANKVTPEQKMKGEPLGETPLLEVASALIKIRINAEKWRVIPDKITLCGFSAGAHLVASLGVHYDEAKVCDALDVLSHVVRPNAMILSYPVITSGEFAHRGSFVNLLGNDASEEELDYYSLEKHVKPSTPPTFLWHTADDASVPVENSLLMASALSKNKVPFAFHVFESGLHGLSVATSLVNMPNPDAAKWVDLATEWLEKYMAV